MMKMLRFLLSSRLLVNILMILLLSFSIYAVARNDLVPGSVGSDILIIIHIVLFIIFISEIIRNIHQVKSSLTGTPKEDHYNDLPIPILRMTEAGGIIFANDAFRSLMSIEPMTKITSLTLADFLISQIETEYLFEKIRTEKIVKNMEIHFRTMSYKPFEALVTGYLIEDVVGNPLMELSLNDMTSIKLLEKERKKMEQLEYRNKYMDSIYILATGIAHDINNILAGINGHAQVIEYRLRDDEVLMRSVNRISDSVRRADDVIQKLMTSIGAYEFRPRLCSIGSFINKAVKELKSVPSDHNYRLITLDEKLKCEIDYELLKEALSEILKNAEAAAGDGGEIIVTTSLEKPEHIVSSFLEEPEYKCVCISVMDKGSGMTAETLEKVFEPFYTTQDYGTGAGLGMTKVYAIVQKHCGAIGIISREGKGTTVSIYLPVGEAKEELR